MMKPATTNPAKKSAPRPREALSTTNDKKRTSDYAETKAISSWKARFAMLGHTLYQVTPANGTTAFLVTRWGMTRELADLTEVAKFFHTIGGKL